MYYSILREDVDAYSDELNVLHAAEGDFFTLRAQLDEKRKAQMIARYEVCSCTYLP